MSDMVDRLLAGALGSLERSSAERAAEESRYGRLTYSVPSCRVYERHEGDVLISTFVIPGLVYELLHIDAGMLL
jgi:hypothetical protein